MLSQDDVKVIEQIVGKAITTAVAPLLTTEEAKNFATKDDLRATQKDILAVRADIAKLDTKVTKFEVKVSGGFEDLRSKTTKDVRRLEKAIAKEHRTGGEILQICEVEDRKIRQRVGRIEGHLGFTSAS